VSEPETGSFESEPFDVEMPPPRRFRGLVKLLAFFVVLLLLFGGAGIYLVSQTQGSVAGKDVTVTIPQGATASSIATLLGDAGVIKSPWLFKLLARWRGVAASLKPGEYTMRTGMSYATVFTLLEKGPAIPFVRVTVPEGSAAGQIAAIVQTKLGITKDAFLAATRDARYRPAIVPEKIHTLEGLLYPDTFFFKEDATAGEVVKRLVDEFAAKTAGLDFAPAKARNLSPYQAVIVASLVEREALVDRDRPLVASVIYNRLERGMHLEIDATVQYAIFLKTGTMPDHITEDDLKISSGYNTYQIPGLPPTPIASPGLKSLAAALNPAKTSYLYYVLSKDGKRHCFASTYNEFLAYKNRTRTCA
jgi:UPF0755 protein